MMLTLIAALKAAPIAHLIYISSDAQTFRFSSEPICAGPSYFSASRSANISRQLSASEGISTAR